MKTIPKYNTYDYFRTIVPSFQSFIPVKRFFLFLSNMAFNKKKMMKGVLLWTVKSWPHCLI